MWKKVQVACILWGLMASAAIAIPLAVETVTEKQLLLPELLWLSDAEEAQNIETISAPQTQGKFVPLSLGFSLKTIGPVWLKLSLAAPRPRLVSHTIAPEQPLSVDLNLPITTDVFIKGTNASALIHDGWTQTAIEAQDIFTLPLLRGSTQIVYMRLAETPGLWFHPVIQPLDSVKVPFLPIRLLITSAFALLAIISLLQSIREKAIWRFWAALLFSCILLQQLCTLPPLHKPFVYTDLSVLLMPGLALLIIPYLGRIILGTNYNAPFCDLFLKSYALVGLCVALVPLLPKYTWLSKLFPLWPLLLAPLFIVSLWALITKRNGGKVFLWFCGFSIGGASITYLCLNPFAGLSLGVEATFWGLAIGGLALAFGKPYTPHDDEQVLDLDFPLLHDTLYDENHAENSLEKAPLLMKEQHKNMPLDISLPTPKKETVYEKSKEERNNKDFSPLKEQLFLDEPPQQVPNATPQPITGVDPELSLSLQDFPITSNTSFDASALKSETSEKNGTPPAVETTNLKLLFVPSPGISKKIPTSSLADVSNNKKPAQETTLTFASDTTENTGNHKGLTMYPKDDTLHLIEDKTHTPTSISHAPEDWLKVMNTFPVDATHTDTPTPVTTKDFLGEHPIGSDQQTGFSHSFTPPTSGVPHTDSFLPESSHSQVQTGDLSFVENNNNNNETIDTCGLSHFGVESFASEQALEHTELIAECIDGTGDDTPMDVSLEETPKLLEQEVKKAVPFDSVATFTPEKIAVEKNVPTKGMQTLADRMEDILAGPNTSGEEISQDNELLTPSTSGISQAPTPKEKQQKEPENKYTQADELIEKSSVSYKEIPAQTIANNASEAPSESALMAKSVSKNTEITNIELEQSTPVFTNQDEAKEGNSTTKNNTADENITAQSEIFTLSVLIENIAQNFIGQAEQKGLTFSWVIDPRVAQVLQGNATELENVLSELLAEVIHLTQAGFIQLTIREFTPTVKEETIQLAFIIIDTGEPDRLCASWNKAESFAQSTKGKFSTNFDDINGFQTLLVSRFTAIEFRSKKVQSIPTQKSISPIPASENNIAQGENIVIADMTTTNLRLISYYLNSCKYAHEEARNITLLPAIFKKGPVGLIIVDLDMPDEDLHETITLAQKSAKENKQSEPVALALISHKGQMERAKKLGCEHTLLKPFSQDDFIATVRLCLPNLQYFKTPTQPTPENKEQQSLISRSTEEYVTNLLSGKLQEPKNTYTVQTTTHPVEHFIDTFQEETTSQEAEYLASLGFTLANKSSSLTLSQDSKSNEVDKKVLIPDLDGESIFSASLPKAPQLLRALKGALALCDRGIEEDDLPAIEKGANLIAGVAEELGLEKLRKIAECVERAAQAQDTEAAFTLYEDLHRVLLRHLESITAYYQTLT